MRSKLPVWRDINAWRNSAIIVTVQVLEYRAGYLLKQITADRFSIPTTLDKPKIALLWCVSSPFVKNSVPIVATSVQFRLWNQCTNLVQNRKLPYRRTACDWTLPNKNPSATLQRALQVRLWLLSACDCKMRHTHTLTSMKLDRGRFKLDIRKGSSPRSFTIVKHSASPLIKLIRKKKTFISVVQEFLQTQWHKMHVTLFFCSVVSDCWTFCCTTFMEKGKC